MNDISKSVRQTGLLFVPIKLGTMLFLLLFLACKADIEPIDGFTDPVFYAHYRLENGTDTVQLVAGVEKIYHFTDFTTGDFIVCTGAFALVTCPGADCPGSVKFEFQGKTIDHVLDKTIFEAGERPYRDAAAPEGGSVAIQWIDPDGRSWRSDRSVQESGTYFRILRSEAYFNNEKGQMTQKMEIAYSCRLSKEGGQEVLFDGTGVVAVAYP